MTSQDQSPAAESVPELAAVFPEPTLGEWDEAMLKVLNRGRPEGKELGLDAAMKRLRSTTIDGLVTEPLYTQADRVELGYPGVAPFTRGTTVKDGDMDAWDVRALHEDPDVATTRQHILTDLERGATSVWLRVDPDAIAASDLGTALADVLLDLAKIDISSHTDQVAAAEAILAIFEASDADHSQLKLNLGLDPIGQAALNGTAADLSRLAEFATRLQGYTKSRAVVVDATHFANAGAGDVHEVAWAIASGIEYVRAMIAQGLTAEQAFDTITFRVSAGVDQFATIARLRALRTLWNRVGEVFEVPAAQRGARQHAVTNFRELTRDDPYVNVLRGTISTFAAAVGGAEAITVLPFDTVAGLPTAFSRRVARNTQLVLAEESNIGRVNDPAGGAWYVEQLTDQLAKAAWLQVRKVEAAGGIAQALADGVLDADLAELRTARAARLANRTRPLTGVSMFPNPAEQPLDNPARPQAPELGGWTFSRDAEVFEQLRDAVGAAGTPSVFLACLGSRRDFGAREGFTQPVVQIAGLATPSGEGSIDEVVAAFTQANTPIAILCSNAKVYAEHGVAAAQALKAAGAKAVYLAGAIKELGAEVPEGAIDGNVFAGMDVVSFLTGVLDQLGVER